MTRQNLLLLLITTGIGVLSVIVKALFIPYILPVEDYGVWQSFVLYSSFVYIACLGFNDGLILRYAGEKDLKNIDDVFSSATIMSLFSLVIISVFYFIFLNNTSMLFMLVALLIVVTGFVATYLNNKGNAKAYRKYIIVDKLLFVAIIIVLYFLGDLDYKSLIYADVISKFVLLLVLLIDCQKEIKYFSYLKFSSISEYYNNISVGLKIMLAGVMSILMLNMGRFYIENFATIEFFSNYSFSISINNIMFLAVSIVSVGVYPFLKKISEENPGNLFSSMNCVASLINVLIIPVYYVSQHTLLNFYPKYNLLNDLLFITISFVPFYVRNTLVYFSFIKIKRLESRSFIVTALLFLGLNFALYYVSKSGNVIYVPHITIFFMFAYSVTLALMIRQVLSTKFIKNVFFDTLIIISVIGVYYFELDFLKTCTVFLLTLLIGCVLNYQVLTVIGNRIINYDYK